jgi:UDP-glucose:(glucosyl)LPS alpha-1,2-glucosyltransferase
MTITTTGEELTPFSLSGGNQGIDEMTAHSRGGTELMRERIFSRLPSELTERFNIISSRVRHVDPHRPNILWCHDCHSDPEARHLANPASRSRFAKLVFVSHWQRDTYQNFLGVPSSQSVVLRNAIVPFSPDEITRDHADNDDGTIRLIYNTTPHRGLEILVPVFERLAQFFGGQIHLDVFSSWSAYGPAWEERDQPYESLFQRCRDHPDITYHGFQPYETIRAALGRAHIQAFPSIWPETSALSVIDAMSAGCEIVCSDLAALPETTAGLAGLYPFHENKAEHARLFENRLSHAIRRLNSDELVNRRSIAKAYTDHVFDIKRRALEWQKLLYSVLGEGSSS